ncbi:MAG: DUF4105 domain-containing protein [Luteolibacter sp.]
MKREKKNRLRKLLKVSGISLLYGLGLLLLIWEFGALWYDCPGPVGVKRAVALLFLLAVPLLVFLKKRAFRIVALGLMLAVMGWWWTLKPSHDRPWQTDVAKLAWAEISGDEVTLHNVRNFDYRTETDYTPRWETRKVKISQITGIDLAVTYWGSRYMAHPILSFQFAEGPPVCFSIETRKEVGESYSAIGGFFRQFELIYIVADERDVIRLRTNYRKGEEVYLYRLSSSPEKARMRFMEYLIALNALKDRPRWYNAATSNCTTAIRTQRAIKDRTRWDWRYLVNGWADEMLYERGSLVKSGLEFKTLKALSRINPDAKSADQSPDFSEKIRRNLPLFQTKD